MSRIYRAKTWRCFPSRMPFSYIISKNYSLGQNSLILQRFTVYNLLDYHSPFTGKPTEAVTKNDEYHRKLHPLSTHTTPKLSV